MLEGPEAGAQAAEAGLHFVADGDYAQLPEPVIEGGVEVPAGDDLPRAALHEFGDEGPGLCPEGCFNCV